MAYEIKGKVKRVSSVTTVSDKFSKRELVIETDGRYPQTISLESSNDRNALLDDVGPGDMVTVQFDLRGRQSNRDERVWNTLSIYKLNVDERATNSRGSDSGQDSIPF
jgi:hypothetical protein